ncbi:hypothetical protein ACFLU7_00215 [Chloroflexota bacterium]
MRMPEIMAKLRWFPLGPTDGPSVPIKKEDLDYIAKQCGVNISLDDVIGQGRQVVDGVIGVIHEDTFGRDIEEISQTVVTVSTDEEEAFRQAIRALLKKYRAPRTTYGIWGSNEIGKRLLVELFDKEDGWV